MHSLWSFVVLAVWAGKQGSCRGAVCSVDGRGPCPVTSVPTQEGAAVALSRGPAGSPAESQETAGAEGGAPEGRKVPCASFSPHSTLVKCQLAPNRLCFG